MPRELPELEVDLRRRAALIGRMADEPWELPSPPEDEGSRRFVFLRLVIAGVLVLVVGFIALAVPIPLYFTYLPGPTKDVQKLVDVDDARTYSSEGKLLLTTVSVDTQVTFVDLVAAAFDPTKDVIRKEEVTGGGSLDQVREQQIAEMRASKQAAREVVLASLGLGTPEGDGARVLATLPSSAARGILQKGDVILYVDGAEVETTCDVGRAISEHSPGDDVTVTVRRDGELRDVRLRAGTDPSDGTSAFLGIHMADVNYEFHPDFRVSFRTGRIAGPSAGLMFSLALYDVLTPEDLTQGLIVAGTGTIACDGGIGAIGGIEEKVAGAERRGAQIFLAPAANAAAARDAARDIDIVAVSTFSDAIAYLEGLE